MTFTTRQTGQDAGLVLDNIAEGLDVEMAEGLLKAGAFVGGEIARVVVRRFPGGTGNLSRSFLPPAFIERRKGLVSVGALSDLSYARIQNDGGTIRPKTAKMLAIPLTPEAREKWPREWPRDSLTLMKSKKGHLLLIDAKSKRIKPHYLLTKTSKIKGRHYLEEAAKNSANDVNAILASMIAGGIEIEIAKVPKT